ncbi:hypothetical protein ACYU03_17620 [Pseudomonas sp. X10]
MIDPARSTRLSFKHRSRRLRVAFLRPAGQLKVMGPLRDCQASALQFRPCAQFNDFEGKP